MRNTWVFKPKYEDPNASELKRMQERLQTLETNIRELRTLAQDTYNYMITLAEEMGYVLEEKKGN